MATTEKKTSTAVSAAPAPATPAPMPEKKAAKGRAAVIEAFMALKPKERSDLYSELALAVANDNDNYSQGKEADNSKYEALLK